MVPLQYFVGSIADNADTISSQPGGPTGARETAQHSAKKNAWRLASFVYYIQKFLGKSISDVTLTGSPAVPEQLLATIHAALVAKGTENWSCPPSPLVVGLIVRVQELAKLADKTMSNFTSSDEDTQSMIEKVHAEKA